MSLHTSCTKLNRFNSTNTRSVYKSRRLSKPVAMSTLISFDVDGTLIRSTGHNANKLHKEAFSAAFKQVFNLDTDIDVVQHHGSTDPLILVKVLVHHGISRHIAISKLPELTTAMVDHFHTNKARAGEGLEVLPGVRELLEELSKREDVCVCLVTGNMEPIGLGKMESLDLAMYFNKPSFFGGFGSDHCSGNFEESWKDRAEFVRIAAQKAEKLLNNGSNGNVKEIKRRVHVGDAPMDVQAAVAAGAKALGLTTGIYTKEELLEVAPEAVVLDGLEDIERVLEELGLEAMRVV